MKRQLSLPALGLALVLSLAGCGTGPSDAGGQGGSSPTQAASGAGAESGSAPNDADVEFTSGMIPHHEQAVEMSELILAKEGIDPKVTDLAVRIKEAQGPEIETMNGWLETWGEPEPGSGAAEGDDGGHGAGHGGGDGGDGGSTGDGMMSAEQLDDLEAAEGGEASRMFLDSMIEHHEGAVAMAKQQLEAGAHPDARELAGSIVQAQESEIEEMEALLAGL